MILREFDQETALIIPDILDMKSPLELTQYYIRDWQLVNFVEGLTFNSLID